MTHIFRKITPGRAVKLAGILIGVGGLFLVKRRSSPSGGLKESEGTVRIVLLSESELADKDSAEIQGKWARLSRQIWLRRPWRYNFTLERLLWGLGRNMGKPFSKAYAALTDEESIVGFTIGYKISRQELRDISKTKNLDRLFSSAWWGRIIRWIRRVLKIPQEVFYIAEFGVDPNRRGERIGQSLANAILAAVREDRIFKAIVLRTEEEALAARHIYALAGFREMGIRDGGRPGRTWWILWLVTRRWWLRWLVGG